MEKQRELFAVNDHGRLHMLSPGRVPLYMYINYDIHM